MFTSNYNKNNFTFKLKGIEIDIFNYDEIMNICKMIMKKIIVEDKDNGLYKFDIYTNYQYGMIIDGKKISNDDDIDIKVNFHIESIFLEEVDYFNYKDKNKIIYYYNNKFYIEYDKDSLIDSYILYGDMVYDILNRGIIVNI